MIPIFFVVQNSRLDLKYILMVFRRMDGGGSLKYFNGVSQDGRRRVLMLLQYGYQWWFCFWFVEAFSILVWYLNVIHQYPYFPTSYSSIVIAGMFMTVTLLIYIALIYLVSHHQGYPIAGFIIFRTYAILLRRCTSPPTSKKADLEETVLFFSTCHASWLCNLRCSWLCSHVSLVFIRLCRYYFSLGASTAHAILKIHLIKQSLEAHCRMSARRSLARSTLKLQM